MPAWFTPQARDFVTRLLIKDPNLRLGGGERDGREVQEHEFFSSTDFAKLEKRQIEPPFVPKIVSETDTANFDPYFTNEAPQITPPEGSVLPGETAKFDGFESIAK